MTDIFKIVAVCLVALFPILLLKNFKIEYAAVVSVAAGVVIFLMLVGNIGAVIKGITDITEGQGSLSSYLKTALKALGIAYITSFAADTCRDFGQTSLAAKAELAGKCAILILALPLLNAILEIAIGFADI